MNMKTNHKKFWSQQLAGLARTSIGLFVVLPLLAGPENLAASDANMTEIQQLRAQLAEQTRRIDRLYDALAPQLEELEHRAAEMKKQAEEDAALKLETVCVLKDQDLTTCAQFSPVDNTFAAVTHKGTVLIFSTAGKQLRELSLPDDRLTAFGYAPDGKRMLVGTRTGKVLLWDLAAEKSQPVFARLEKPVCHLLWLPNPDRFVVAYEKTLGEYAGFIVRLADDQPVFNFSSRWQIPRYQAIAASSDGKWIGALDVPDEERAGFLLNSTNVEIKVKLRDDDYPSGPLSIGIAPDNNTVAVGYAPYNLGLWDAAQRKELRLVKAHSNWVTTLGFSPDSQRLISGGGDSTARIWEVATGKEIGRIRFEGESTYVNSVGFSADGQLVFGAAENDVLIVAKAPK